MFITAVAAINLPPVAAESQDFRTLPNEAVGNNLSEKLEYHINHPVYSDVVYRNYTGVYQVNRVYVVRGFVSDIYRSQEMQAEGFLLNKVEIRIENAEGWSLPSKFNVYPLFYGDDIHVPVDSARISEYPMEVCFVEDDINGGYCLIALNALGGSEIKCLDLNETYKKMEEEYNSKNS